MKWMGFFLSEHTSSLYEDKTKEDFTSHLEGFGEIYPIKPTLYGTIIGKFSDKG